MAERRKPRLRRADPKRTAPVRNASYLFRGESETPAEETPPPARGNGTTAWSDAVAHGVDTGYRVLEEQLRQGRRMAEEIAGGRGFAAAPSERNLRDLGDRAMRYYGDLIALCMEALDTLLARGAGGGRDAEAYSPPRRPADAEPGAEPGRAGALAVVEVASRRPAEVSLRLEAGAGQAALEVGMLVARETGVAPLTDVAIERVPGEGTARVRLRVPDEQPAGRYNAVVLDAESGLPRGTLSVRLAE